MVIRMNKFGRSLTTRVAGREAYDEISKEMSHASDRIVFDFAGVDVITNSFADEVFGRMVFETGMDSLRSRTTFRNIDRFWAKVIRTAMDARESQRGLAMA